MNEHGDSIVDEFDAELSSAQRDAIALARDFGRRVVGPEAERWERERRVPREALGEACTVGLAGIEVPIEFGGLGLGFSTKMRVVEELAKHDFGFAFSLVNHHNAIVRVARAPGVIAKRLVAAMLHGEVIGCAAYTEPDHGSDLAGITTHAQKVAGGWLLNGRKAWITNAAVAGVLLTLAQTEPGAGAKGLGLFLVEADRAGFVREPPYALDGCHTIGVGGFRLENCLVPDEGLVDPPGASFAAALVGINGARCYVAAMCAGMLESAIEQAARYAGSRRAFGQTLLDFQGLRWSLVDAETDLAALRLLTYRAASLIDAGRPVTEEAARAKQFAGRHTLVHIAACIQVMGANGLRAAYPLMRHLAACKTASYTDGTTEMMNERLGKILIRRYVSDSTQTG